MAKVTVVFTRPGKVRDLDGLIEKLNSTFQQELKDDLQRFSWFTSSSSGVNNG